jgi:hypothetical protein
MRARRAFETRKRGSECERGVRGRGGRRGEDAPSE